MLRNCKVNQRFFVWTVCYFSINPDLLVIEAGSLFSMRGKGRLTGGGHNGWGRCDPGCRDYRSADDRRRFDSGNAL